MLVSLTFMKSADVVLCEQYRVLELHRNPFLDPLEFLRTYLDRSQTDMIQIACELEQRLVAVGPDVTQDAINCMLELILVLERTETDGRPFVSRRISKDLWFTIR